MKLVVMKEIGVAWGSRRCTARSKRTVSSPPCINGASVSEKGMLYRSHWQSEKNFSDQLQRLSLSEVLHAASSLATKQTD